MDAMNLMSAPLQGAFAGLSLILIGVIIWLIKQLLVVLKDNNRIVAANTAAINAIYDTTDETKRLLSNIRDDLMTRPCLLDGKK